MNQLTILSKNKFFGMKKQSFLHGDALHLQGKKNAKIKQKVFEQSIDLHKMHMISSIMDQLFHQRQEIDFYKIEKYC